MEWTKTAYGYKAHVEKQFFRVLVTLPEIEAHAELLRGAIETTCSNVDEAKAWCESHYRDWYNSLPVPTPEVVK